MNANLQKMGMKIMNTYTAQRAKFASQGHSEDAMTLSRCAAGMLICEKENLITLS